MFRRAHHADLDSTNLEASRRVAAGAITGSNDSPLLISADRQGAGRGRAGRAWRSPIGGLWLSLAWPLRHDPARYESLPLAAGLAVLEAVERQTGLAAMLKWPNDLLADDRKLAGLLCAMELAGPWPAAIIGVGVNANLRASDLGDRLRLPPATLMEQLGKPVDLKMMRETIAETIADRLRALEAGGFEALRPAVEARLAFRGGAVSIEGPAGASQHGRLIGVDHAGRLLLDAPQGRTAVRVGDVTHLSPHPPSAGPSGRAPDLELSR